MSLQPELIDMVFTKLTLVYGRDFLARWEGLNLSDVKNDWAHELSGFARHPEAIAYALQNLTPGKPPTVLEFRAIARKVPQPEFVQLPAPQADREKVKELLDQARQRMGLPSRKAEAA